MTSVRSSEVPNPRAQLLRLLVPSDCSGCGYGAVVLVSAEHRQAPYCSLCTVAMVMSWPEAFYRVQHPTVVTAWWSASRSDQEGRLFEQLHRVIEHITQREAGEHS